MIVKNAAMTKDNAENAALVQTMGFESNKEYNEIMFLREITHTVNMFNDMGDIVSLSYQLFIIWCTMYYIFVVNCPIL